jgi:hypothetical protein
MDGDHRQVSNLALDDLIAARIERPRQDPQIALMVRRLTRVVAVPAMAAMFGGLIVTLFMGLTPPLSNFAGGLPGPSALSLADLAQPGAALSGRGAMSAGMVALAALPAIIVLFILVGQLRARRWIEAAVAAGVIGVLALSAIVGH